jgi:hypothetical protein
MGGESEWDAPEAAVLGGSCYCNSLFIEILDILLMVPGINWLG